jgi:hypothetical protein
VASVLSVLKSLLRMEPPAQCEHVRNFDYAVGLYPHSTAACCCAPYHAMLASDRNGRPHQLAIFCKAHLRMGWTWPSTRQHQASCVHF